MSAWKAYAMRIEVLYVMLQGYTACRLYLGVTHCWHDEDGIWFQGLELDDVGSSRRGRGGAGKVH